MSQAIDERTPYNVNHARQTAEYAKGIIHYLRERFPPESAYYFDENREEQLILAVLLHDIGKVVTPLNVMSKESRLADRLPLIRQRLAISKLQAQVELLSGNTSEDAYSVLSERLSETLAFVERINTTQVLSDSDEDRVSLLEELTYVDDADNSVPIFEPYDIECLSVKNGTLTQTEREAMQEHVAVGERLLKNIKFNKQYDNVPGWVLKHHEYLDGTGYPNNISHDEIPLEARIITILDIFEALTARDRPYRKSLNYEDSSIILRKMAREGKIDEELTELFLESGIGRHHDALHS